MAAKHSSSRALCCCLVLLAACAGALGARVRQADDVQPQLLYAGGGSTVPVVTSNSNYIANVEQYKTAKQLLLERGGNEADKELAENDKRNRELMAEDLNKVNSEDKYKQSLILYRKNEAEKLSAGFDADLKSAQEKHEEQAAEEDKKLKEYRDTFTRELSKKREQLVEADNKRAAFVMQEQKDKFAAERREKTGKDRNTDKKRLEGMKELRKKQKEDREKQELRRKKLDERKIKFKVRAAQEEEEEAASDSKRREQVRRAREREQDLSEEQLEEKDKREENLKRTQRQRIREKEKEDQIKERDEKSLTFNGMCTVSPQCASGWTDKGLCGMIVRNVDLTTTQFAKGGTWGDGWTWIHPRLCCSQDASLDVSNQYMLDNRCPEGAAASGVAGVILQKSTYDQNPFESGGELNPEWKWAHPFLCRTPTKSLLRKSNFNTCVFGTRCAAPWKDHGNAGLIMFTEHKDSQPFSQGAALNDQWTWIHPRLCCV